MIVPAPEEGLKPATAGRGLVALTFSRSCFLLASWIIYFFLPRIITHRQWGDFLILFGLASVFNTVVAGGALFGVSRATAVGEHDPARIRWAGMKMQTLSGLLSVVVFASLGVVLTRWWRDPALLPYFIVISLMAFFHSYYGVFAGSANGQKRFGRQAALEIAYSTGKVAFVIGGAALMSSVLSRNGLGAP